MSDTFLKFLAQKYADSLYTVCRNLGTVRTTILEDLSFVEFGAQPGGAQDATEYLSAAEESLLEAIKSLNCFREVR